MSVRIYGKEEKQAYVEDYKKSGKTIARYALENGIPETTLRGWIKEDQELTFEAIEIKSTVAPLPNGATDFRKQIPSLCGIIRDNFKMKRVNNIIILLYYLV